LSISINGRAGMQPKPVCAILSVCCIACFSEGRRRHRNGRRKIWLSYGSRRSKLIPPPKFGD
jgi:hypothetical protein